MKKEKSQNRLLLFVMVMITISLPIKSTFAQNAIDLYKSMSKEFATDHPFVSFVVDVEQRKDDSTLWTSQKHVFLDYDEKNPTIYVDYLSEGGRIRESQLLDTKKYICIDHDSYEITRYDNKKMPWDDYHDYGLFEFIPHAFYYLSYYLYPMKGKIRGGLMMYTISNIQDQESITVNDKLYTKFHGISNTLITTNGKTGKRMLAKNKAAFFVNQETKVLDSVYVIQTPSDYEKWETFVSIRDVVFSDPQKYIDDVFNLEKAEYKNYSRHDSKNPPLSRAYSRNKGVTEALLNYPLQKLDSGLTTLADNKGWVLLNFWSVNCPPCLAHLKELGHEKDSLGTYILESKGIKILAINHRSDNVDLIRSIAEKTNTSEIVYYANGIGDVISIRFLNYYYLISPDRQIVYETWDLGDYSELLKAKADYEKRHPELSSIP
ncbi:MAG: TlpA family protein disulfide reductase [Bacteroidales bacterium]|jgi:hypothetical protein